MKHRCLPLSLALSALLPLVSLAEAPQTGPADRGIGPPSKETWPARAAAGSNDRPGADMENKVGSPTPDSAPSAPGSSISRPMPGASLGPASSEMGASGQARRISSDELERRVTALSLIGKKVLDREGQEIGKVKDIGLTPLASHLSTSTASASQMPATPSSGREPRILVQAIRALGTEGDLVAIPASQIMRDGDHLRVDTSRDQLRDLLLRSPGLTSTEE